MKWANHQRINLLNKAEHLKSATIDRQEEDTQELFTNMLNEIKSMNNTCNRNGILDNTIVSKHACNNLGIQISDDLESIQYFADSVIIPNTIPPMPENSPEKFISLLQEYFKHECHRHIGCCELTWGKKLSMRCSRRSQLFKLVSDNSRKHKPLYSSAKYLDKKLAHAALKMVGCKM